MSGWPKLVLALDLPPQESESALRDLGDLVPCFKVGLNTIVSPYLEKIAKGVTEKGKLLFLDAKLHDIPNTVANAARALVELGARYFTVHASGGEPMMRAAREAAAERAEALGLPAAPEPVAVTVLTSMDQAAWGDLFATKIEIRDQVLRLVERACRAGVNSVVASPLEAESIRARFGTDLSIVTPGVRPSWAAKGDQKRTAGPADALARGATALVIGRPILYPPEEVGGRRQAVERIAQEIGGL